MFFKSSSEKILVKEIKLKKDYAFMYENFVVSSQQVLYVLLEESNDKISALKFDSIIYKYGHPNDETGHPLYKFGLGNYGFYEVINSDWIKEIRSNNREHPKHIDNNFDKDKHFIVKFKDVTIEVICTEFEEVEITRENLVSFLAEQINYLKKE